jgi:hypothetical protein
MGIPSKSQDKRTAKQKAGAKKALADGRRQAAKIAKKKGP